MKAVLQEPEFKGRFREIVFAVYSKPGAWDSSNFATFKEVFDKVEI